MCGGTDCLGVVSGEQWMDHLTSLWANNKFRDEKAGIDLGRTVEKVS